MTLFERFLERVIQARQLQFILVGFLLLGGYFTYKELRVDLFPPLNFPILNIMTELPSFSSLEIERQVTLPIENAVGGVLGVRKVRSVSATGISKVSAEFEWGTDLWLARQLVTEAINSVRTQLPAGASPVMENLSASLSMIEGYSFQAPEDLVRLREIALFELRPRLQKIPGVYRVRVMGGKQLEYSVFANPFLMIKYDVTLQDITEALYKNNIIASPGVVNRHQQELLLHANEQFANETEIENVVIAVKSGVPIRIRDLAKVSRGNRYERGDASENGSSAVIIDILKQPSFDTTKVSQAISEEISRFQSTLPKGYTIRNYYDQAELVEDSIGSVKESVWQGGLLVILVLAFFLHSFRTTVIATLSIPISVMAAIIMMKVFGAGLNIMSLGGLAIGTGIIVDDTIVVLENIFRWLSTPTLRKNLPNTQVVIQATKEVLRPVVYSTLTNIAIFLPMIYVEGFAGRLFTPVSITVTFALLASLAVALTFIPSLADQWLAKQNWPQEKEGKIHELYSKPLRFALKRTKVLLVISMIPLFLVAKTFKSLEVEFLPALDEGAIQIESNMPPGTSLVEAKRLNEKIESWAKEIPGVITVVRKTGHAPGAENTDNVNHSDLYLKLISKEKRPLSLDELLDQMKEKASSLTSSNLNYLMPLADKINDALGGIPVDLGVDIFGPDLKVLHEYSEKLRNRMLKIPGVNYLKPPTDLPVPSLEIQVDKQEAGRLGISESSIHDTLQAYSLGVDATEVRELQKLIPVTVHFVPPGQDIQTEMMKTLPLRTNSGNTVPLGHVAQLGFGMVPNEIYHEQMTRKLTIGANLKGRNSTEVARDVEKAIGEIGLPKGYSWGFSGKYRTEQSALSNMAMVLGMAITIVAFILWLEFRSMIQVGLILMTLPLAAVGAVFSLWFFKQTVNVSSMMGAIMLVGIVVRNGIMLLDCANGLLYEGHSLDDALYHAAMKRVRPILMTATVTILGLLPLAIGWGAGAELQKPLAIAVIGGILTSTLLTLVVLPAGARLLMGVSQRE